MRFHSAGPRTYPVQVYVYAPARIYCGCFAAQRHYAAEDADGLVGEGVEVFGVDAGGGFGGHGGGFAGERVWRGEWVWECVMLVTFRGCRVGEGCGEVGEFGSRWDDLERVLVAARDHVLRFTSGAGRASFIKR